MRFHILLFLSFLFSFDRLGWAQPITPDKLGFTAYTINHKEWGEIHYYISSGKDELAKPLLLYLDGSGPFPLFQYTKLGIASSVAFDFRALAEHYHIVLISKPGVPFIDSVHTDPQSGYPQYPEPLEYTSRLSLDWRVQAARLVLDHLKTRIRYDKTKVVALGISEGFQVGAKLAATDKRITHLLLFAGNGLNQFYDFIIQNRMDAVSGKITEKQAQDNIDSLYMMFRDINTYPTATEKKWFGHTYLRWSSFCQNNPTDNIMSLSIPVYIAAGSQDRNTTALSTDYLYLESIRRGKTNVSYKVYPYDHSFNEAMTDAEGRVVSMKSHMHEVVAEGLQWLSVQHPRL